MKVGFIFLFVCLFTQIHSFAQQKKHLIYLKDKKGNGYSLEKPEVFLTTRALERRKKQGIKLEENDLPINSNYIEKIKKEGAKIWYTSRWLNAVMIEADENVLTNIKKLPFIAPQNTYLAPSKFSFEKAERFTTLELKPLEKSLEIKSEKDYGDSYNQMKMVGATQMHKNNIRGKGMIVAIFDSGFENGNKVSFFEHLYKNTQVLGTFDFVLNKNDVYTVGSHGLKVLSTIASYDKNLIGTAPEAHFYLFRTEDANTEYRVEELNWTIAAEKADSLGVDVINSSLGYTDFNDEKMSYTYKDMNGKTCMSSKSATLAATKGILVVSSAGNEGNDDWKYVSAPGDADLIMTVGAVNADGDCASFSSLGPTSDKRQKPNITAQGAPTVVGSPSGNIITNSGTSFSSPLMAGFAASFWSEFPYLKNSEVIEIIQLSGSKSKNPDYELGFGIPNYAKAKKIAEERKKDKKDKK